MKILLSRHICTKKLSVCLQCTPWTELQSTTGVLQKCTTREQFYTFIKYIQEKKNPLIWKMGLVDTTPKSLSSLTRLFFKEGPIWHFPLVVMLTQKILPSVAETVKIAFKQLTRNLLKANGTPTELELGISQTFKFQNQLKLFT